MKRFHSGRCTSVAAIAAVAIAYFSMAGPLDPPPGPVSPTYKTLSDVEPRVVVNGANTPGNPEAVCLIAQPGSYYLAAIFTGISGRHGIMIDADGVTLDLCGFELRGVSGSLDGVHIVPGRSGVTVRNGSIRGWGESGVSAVGGPNARNCLFQDLRLTGNSTGGSFYALDMGGSSTAVNCVAVSNLGSGIRGNDGCLITGCTASGHPGDGIICGAGVVRDCVVRGNGVDGIRVGAAAVVSGCSATANGEAGITVHSGATAHGNACFGNVWGMYVFAEGCRVEGNNLWQNGTGMEVLGAKNVVVRNSVSGSASANYVIGPGNDVGPIGSAATAASPWANIEN